MAEKLLIAFVSSADSVCCRYRLAAFIPYLEAHGWNVELRPLPRNFLERFRAFRATGDADAVFLQRKLINRFQMTVLRRNARKLIFDFDDAIFQRNTFARKRARTTRQSRRFRFTVKSADIVLAGNSMLAEEARRFAAPGSVHVLPTCVDLNHYSTQSAESDRRSARDFTMVWVGSSSTVSYLENSRDLWESVGKALPDVHFKVICDRFPRFENLRSRNVEWSGDSEAAEIIDADAGVSVLLDDTWSRGKCGLKLLQYMAAGLPVVTNPVGVHAEMVEHGHSGFLVTTPSEWIEALKTLSSDRELARSMGRRGREIVRENYSVDRWAPELLRLLD